MTELRRCSPDSEPAEPSNGGERDRYRDWNERVSVCRDHTHDITDGPCVICQRDEAMELLRDISGKLHALTIKRGRHRQSCLEALVEKRDRIDALLRRVGGCHD